MAGPVLEPSFSLIRRQLAQLFRLRRLPLGSIGIWPASLLDRVSVPLSFGPVPEHLFSLIRRQLAQLLWRARHLPFSSDSIFQLKLWHLELEFEL